MVHSLIISNHFSFSWFT